ncbi:MAG TPA: DUF924 family protein [Usitatibacter sp.]|nr:DUF924 family protein [Usitatibacter sp.]
MQLFVPSAGDVLDFWFGPEASRGATRAEWFRKDGNFDARIRDRFGELHAMAARRELESWRGEAASMLALVVVLDQFSRNLFRDDARAFAQDPYARECVREAIARGDEGKLLPVERMFLYLPFEHSEDIDDQRYAIDRMRSLEAFPETKGLTQWAEKHEAVVRRFGRFPHRNAILGRASTPEEMEFLREPGSRF